MKKNDVIAISPSPKSNKIAALFFDYINPFYRVGEVPEGIVFPLLREYRPTEYDLQVNLTRAEKKKPQRYTGKNLHNIYLNENVNFIRDRLAQDGIRSAPIFIEAEYHESFVSTEPENSVEVKLINSPIIDTENLSWAHIVDMRKDVNFKARARAFRLFLVDNYQHKSKDYIYDSLANKLYEYEMACKEHGVSLVLSTAKSTLNSKSLLTSGILAASSVLLGEPLVAGSSLLVGAAIEIGKISIEVAEKKLTMKSFKNKSEISFLFDLEKAKRT